MRDMAPWFFDKPEFLIMVPKDKIIGYVVWYMNKDEKFREGLNKHLREWNESEEATKMYDELRKKHEEREKEDKRDAQSD